MKQIHFFIFLILVLCWSINSKQSLAKDKLPKHSNYSVRDSLTIFDSLVKFNKINNNALAVKYATQALAVAQHSNTAEYLFHANQLLGIAYFQNKMDSSFYYYNVAAKIAEDSKSAKQKVIILYNMAALYNVAYNYKMAITFLDSSIRLAQLTKDYQGISNGYNMIGLIKVNTHDYESARQHFTSALKVAQEHFLYEQMGVALGNLARAWFEPDTVKSISMQRDALNYLRKVRGTEEEMALILINIGNRCANPDTALVYYKSALSLSENAQLPTIMIGAYNNMAYSYLDKKNYTKAEECVRDLAIPIALKNQLGDWLSSLYDTYADVCVARGDLKKAVAMQKNALNERVADYKQKAAEQVRLLAAQLDLQNKELIIKNEESKILLQRNQLQKTELGFAITALLVIISIFIMLFLQHRNKVKFHQEQVASARRIIEMEESEKGRTARELHDLTGQLVLGISGMIENIEFSEPEVKQLINDRIKEMGTSIRRISHRMNRAMIEHFTFSELISGLCMDVQKLIGLKINFEIPEELPELPNDLVLHFYRITQELLTNAGKYAKQSTVNIVISYQQNELSLLYFDHGPGFIQKEKSSTGVGIINIFERVKLVNGKATIKSDPGIGTRWEFTFPLESKKTLKS